MSYGLVIMNHALRVFDNPAFYQAMLSHEKVIVLYHLDTDTIGGAQHWWIYHSLKSLDDRLQEEGSHLTLSSGDLCQSIDSLIKTYPIKAVYWTRQYDINCIQFYSNLKKSLKNNGIDANSYNGYVIHEPMNLFNQQGSYFKVFTPYWKAAQKQTSHTHPLPTPPIKPNPTPTNIHTLAEFNLLPHKPNWAIHFGEHFTPGEKGALNAFDYFLKTHLTDYEKGRDYPAERHTSKLSPHLHFGEISPRYLYHTMQSLRQSNAYPLKAIERFETELGWREFSTYLLYHFNRLPFDNVNPLFNTFPWIDNPLFLDKWQTGQTGFPIVDAGMRELWETGYMHNRVRMIVASFLTKDLFINWRLGAAWFWDTLLDADLANNSASWQWVAGCGADAAPYFRVFNPTLQSQKFDPEGKYIKRYVKELSHLNSEVIHDPASLPLKEKKGYPHPIISHKEQREIALESYQLLKKTIKDSDLPQSV